MRTNTTHDMTLQPTRPQRARDLGHEELLELHRSYQDTRDLRLRNRLVELHLGLVGSISWRYRREGDLACQPDELFADGTTGLMKALDGFDWRKGFEFSTYATYHIRGAILRGIEQRQSGDRVLEEFNRVNLDADVHRGSNGDARPLGEVVADPDAIDPAEFASAAHHYRSLRAAVAQLPEDQRQVVEMRFGLTAEPSEPMRLSEIAEQLGVTVTRVHQIERQALVRLRASAALNTAA
jgi:RNA polymerase primary sigma factor